MIEIVALHKLIIFPQALTSIIEYFIFSYLLCFFRSEKLIKSGAPDSAGRHCLVFHCQSVPTLLAFCTQRDLF